MRRIARRDRLGPDLIEQARQPESRFGELMSRDSVCLVEVSSIQFDGASRGIDAGIEGGLAWFDGDVQGSVDVGARDLIRLPRDILSGDP